ncbi:FAD:protein FMN transferase [Rubrivivax rivuli]|uniref:FAD:protein FMN transferase n=1 Tax=Rubrivivax rivuli TaxID=1862385 RepID=A0A437RSI8_9BURK|nr:FAD:protein FMN transferase [Rubrivivax rivuli]RVU49719.1 FAD:protein FMN transferase [Rubrivivax rivuli]
MLLAATQPAQMRFDFARRTFGRSTAGWVVREEAIMGTAIRVELWAEDRRQGEAAAAAVMDEMHRIDRTYSPHKAGSELSRINREAGTRAVPLSEETCGLVERALAFSRLTDGAFDISYAAAGRLYDYRQRQRPTAEALAAARAAVGWQHLLLDSTARTLRFGREGMCIDLGGFAKGHAVDRAAAALRQRGVQHAYVAAGGDSRVIGSRRDTNAQGVTEQRPWTVAIRDPRRAGEVVAVLPLEDCSVSTSGDYERYFDDGAERVHHLLDPATGRSPQHVHSVTVISADGLTSEALSKAVFVMGVERGLALVNSLQGVDAVVVDASGALHASAGLLHGGPAAPVTRQ